MTGVTAVHEEKETLPVDVNLPGHDERVTTPLFTRTRKAMLERENGRCFICNRTEAEAGAPLESHHVWIERCLANAADWTYFRDTIFQLERILGYTADFCREHETLDDIMTFVDDQTINGLPLCKEHHTSDGLDIPCGIHTMPFPLWLFQRYGRDGFEFTSTETIAHADETPAPSAAAVGGAK
jgi:hypothetical protein